MTQMTTRPLRIAHRGLPRLARENTLSSFALALEAGADGIELDVHATSDGAVVVHHDPALTNGLLIAGSTLEAVRSTTGATVPTLGEVCALVNGRAELFVEIKGNGIEQLVLAVMRRYQGSFAIHSFDHAMIARIHAVDPRVRLGVLFEDGPLEVGALMDATGARDVWPHAPLITRQMVDDVHARGGRVIAWTVNSRADTDRLASWGVDGLCGDDVRTFAAD